MLQWVIGTSNREAARVSSSQVRALRRRCASFLTSCESSQCGRCCSLYALRCYAQLEGRQWWVFDFVADQARDHRSKRFDHRSKRFAAAVVVFSVPGDEVNTWFHLIATSTSWLQLALHGCVRSSVPCMRMGPCAPCAASHMARNPRVTAGPGGRKLLPLGHTASDLVNLRVHVSATCAPCTAVAREKAVASLRCAVYVVGSNPRCARSFCD